MIVEGGGYTIHLTQHHQRILCTPTKGNSPSPRLTVNGLRRIGSAMRSRPEKRKKNSILQRRLTGTVCKAPSEMPQAFLVALSKSTEAWNMSYPDTHPLSQQSFWIFCAFNASSSCIQMELHHPPSQASLLSTATAPQKACICRKRVPWSIVLNAVNIYICGYIYIHNEKKQCTLPSSSSKLQAPTQLISW